jgi:imidazolonepropionase-like amidohydrolase
MSAAPAFTFSGLVDAHVHLTFDFAGDGPAPGSARLAANRARLHAAGILAARDAGRLATEPPVTGEGIVAAGAFLAPAGGFHADLHEPVAPDALVATALAQVDAGAQWVKLIADFPGPDGNWFAPRVTYEPDLVAELAAAVHGAGARLMAHVSGPLVGTLVSLGVDSIEHGPLVDAALLEEMAERGTLWTPTVATIVSYVGTLPQWRETIPRAVDLGVPVLAGSDELGAGALWREAVALHEHGGLTPAQALAAASDVPRRALGLPAGPQDLVACPVDPRSDPRALAHARPIGEQAA